MTSATAPGKIILLGEHAVVYGQPALAIPVSQVGVTVNILDIENNRTINTNWKENILISAPAIGKYGYLSEFGVEADPITCVIDNVLKEIGISEPPRIKILIQSTIPVASGLGSGAAVSVALTRALAARLGKSLPDEKISQIGFEAEKIHHGTPSGIDNSVITYAKPVYFIKGKPIETFVVKKPFWLIIADSGTSSATKDTVGDVRKAWKNDPKKYELIFSQIGGIVEEGRRAIQEGDIAYLGNLMNKNQTLLKELSVSSYKLNRLILAALANGALGAKLSGGGRGGNIISLAYKDNIQSLEKALIDAGAQNTIITEVTQSEPERK